jgi:hypothetical protein
VVAVAVVVAAAVAEEEDNLCHKKYLPMFYSNVQHRYFFRI